MSNNDSLTWLVQSNFIDNSNTRAVSFAVQNTDAKFAGVNVVPFTYHISESGVSEDIGKIVVPYGSTKLTKLAIKTDWLGVFYNDNFDANNWNINREDMLNADMVAMKASGVLEFIKDMPGDSPLFIRPVKDLKAFAGTLTDVFEIRSWMKHYQAGNSIFSEDTEVCLASAKQILSETRWFIVDGKVIDGSVYRLRGQRVILHETNEEHIRQAQKLADKWLPHEVCVMDVAEVEGSLKVIEFNCFNSSGLYANDANKIVRAVNTYMRKKFA